MNVASRIETYSNTSVIIAESGLQLAVGINVRVRASDEWCDESDW
jgi:hypothetical protein